jgi:hypothetical protein
VAPVDALLVKNCPAMAIIIPLAKPTIVPKESRLKKLTVLSIALIIVPAIIVLIRYLRR